jgi:cbb3-type cytochrome oxidase maturation protein
MPARDEALDVLYLLIPLSLLLVALIVAALVWAIRSGQFEDLEGPAHRILLDDDDSPEVPPTGGENRGDAPPATRDH